MKLIKKIIPKHIKVFLYEKYKNHQLNEKYKNLKKYKKIFVFGSPDHGNLGDHAITKGQVELLKDNFKEYKIVEITLLEYKKNVPFLKKYINEEDIITINGGGNFGSEYLFDENIRRNIVKNFPNNRIILFPQTIYFTNDEKGKDELEKSKKIYEKHKNFILVAREKVSFELMKENFKNNNIILAPDIVLYLNKSKNSINREGALFCMRRDLESKLSEEERESILELLKINYNNVTITDTVVNKNVTKEERENILNSKFEEFRRSELVITDRIHGMIFAAITGTPCIALSNYNQKVSGTYEWIKHLEYIKFSNNINEVKRHINELDVSATYKYDNSYAIKEYYKIINEILK